MYCELKTVSMLCCLNEIRGHSLNQSQGQTFSMNDKESQNHHKKKVMKRKSKPLQKESYKKES